MAKLKINVSYKYKMMQSKWKFRLGAIFCLIGTVILLTSFLIGRFIPGGFALLAIGLILISESRK